MGKPNLKRDNNTFAELDREERRLGSLLQQVLSPPTDSERAARQVAARIVEARVSAGERSAGRVIGQRWALAGGLAALGMVVTAVLLVIFSSEPVLAAAIRQLEETKCLLVEITQNSWTEGQPEPTLVRHGQIWALRDRQFHDLGDRKEWVFEDKSISYYPKDGRVVINLEETGIGSQPLPANLASVVALMRDSGATLLPVTKMTVDGHGYDCLTAVHASATDMEVLFLINPQNKRLDYYGGRITTGSHKGRFKMWAKLTYDPAYDEKIFEPDYPDDVTTQTLRPREDMEDILKRWKPLALATEEKNGVGIGLLEVWRAPDGLIGIHLYEYNIWPSGTAFPDEYFPEGERKGGFSAREWLNTNVLLEAPEGIAHRPDRNIPLANHMFWCRGKGRPLREAHYFFDLSDSLAKDQISQATLHFWKLRARASGLSIAEPKKKENFAYITLTIPLPETVSDRPTSRFIDGLQPAHLNRPREALKSRAWLLERSGRTQDALRLISEQPIQMQHRLAWEKLRLLKALGRREEVDRFLRVHIPWRKENDQYHESNIPRLIKEFASPEFTVDQ